MKKALMALSLLFIFSSFALSSNLGLKSITAKAGVLLPEDPWETGFQLGAKADLGELAEGINLVPFVAYWSSSYDFSGFNESLSLDMSNIKLGASARYAVPSVKGLYGEAGVSINFLSVDFPGVTVFGISSGGGSDTSTEFGLVLAGGYQIPLGGMTGVLELEYNIMDLSALEVSFGILFDMAK